MAKSAVYKKGGQAGVVEFNMTPMIDVTFQLIIFFILAGQIASNEIAQLKLPDPTNSQAMEAKKIKVTNKVTVNVVSADPDGTSGDPMKVKAARAYIIGGVQIDVADEGTLLDVLMDRKQASKARGEEGFFVEIRGDRRVNFDEIQPIPVAAAKAEIPRMNISAFLELGE